MRHSIINTIGIKNSHMMLLVIFSYLTTLLVTWARKIPHNIIASSQVKCSYALSLRRLVSAVSLHVRCGQPCIFFSNPVVPQMTWVKSHNDNLLRHGLVVCVSNKITSVITLWLWTVLLPILRFLFPITTPIQISIDVAAFFMKRSPVHETLMLRYSLRCKQMHGIAFQEQGHLVPLTFRMSSQPLRNLSHHRRRVKTRKFGAAILAGGVS